MKETQEPKQPFNHGLSQALAALELMRPKECFRNAILAIEFFPKDLARPSGFQLPTDLTRDDCQVVQGYVLGQYCGQSTLLHPHGWLEANGEIIDPTPAWSDGHALAYFPGNCFSSGAIEALWDDLAEAECETGIEGEGFPLPPLDSPGMVAARDTALAWCAERAIQVDDLPEWMDDPEDPKHRMMMRLVKML